MDTLRQIRLFWKPLVFVACLAPLALVLGDAEVDRREVGIKPLREHREQETVSFDALATRVAHLLELV